MVVVTLFPAPFELFSFDRLSSLAALEPHLPRVAGAWLTRDQRLCRYPISLGIQFQYNTDDNSIV